MRTNRISCLLFALALPTAMFANTVDFAHQGGTLAGGIFEIPVNGYGGISPVGVPFKGTVESPVVWSLITIANGTHSYTLTGTLLGEHFTKPGVTGAMVALTVNVGKGFFPGSATLWSGDLDLNGSGIGLRMSAPEPMSISLFGIGLISIAGLVRYRLNREKEHPHA